jgi:hypothetical protein
MNKLISLETALQRSSFPDELQEMINRGVGVVRSPASVQRHPAGARK